MSKREQVQTEALETALQHKRCGLAISMGVGKTLIGLRYINSFRKANPDLKVLVVAPKISIFDSWLSDAQKFNIDIEDFHFTTYLSLSKETDKYDIIVLDECHSLLNSHSDWLKAHEGRILGLTGTPPKHRWSEKGEMVERFCPIVYKYIVDEAVGDKILNDYEIKIHMISLNTAKNIKMTAKNGASWYTSERESYGYWSNRVNNASTPKERQITSVMRMKQMMEYPSKEKYTKQLLENIEEKCIVFANTIAQARRLCEYTYDSENPDSDGNLTLFKNGRITELSCVLQLNEGINVPHLKEGIILHAYGNERKSSQRIGRLLRLNPDDKATVHILCYKETVDEKWVTQALADFDQKKITVLNMGEQTLKF